MPSKTLNNSHPSATIKTNPHGLMVLSAHNPHTVNISNHGNVNVTPNPQNAPVPGINANTVYKINLLTGGAGGDVLVTY